MIFEEPAYAHILYLEPLITFMLEIGLHNLELILKKTSDFLKDN